VNNPITTSDGELLSVKLKKVESFRRRTALLLVAPLLLFIIFTYIMPIASLMWRSIDNTLLNSLLSNTNEVIHEWNGMDLPNEDVFEAFYKDLRKATENKEQGKIAIRLNYELSGMSSLTKKDCSKNEEI
jgi:putative spermidine/putrescine transport system permease protein